MITKRLGGLQKYSKEEKKKFENNKPLIEYTNSWYPDRFVIKYRKFEPPKDFDLYDAMDCKKVDLGNHKIIFGINAEEEEFTQYDFLDCPDGPAFVVHNRVLKIFNELCPDDFQALPVIIKNNNPKGKQFENKDFWLINILNLVDIIDQEKSEAYWDGDFLRFKQKMYLYDAERMAHFKMARIENKKPWIIFHPLLAKHFINSRGVQFLTDEEAPT